MRRNTVDNLTREQALTEAFNAATESKRLATYAGSAAHGSDQARAQGLAAAGGLWADVARSYAALAVVLPELPETGSES